MKPRKTFIAALLAGVAAVLPFGVVAAESPTEGNADRRAGRSPEHLTDEIVTARVKNAIANVEGIQASEVEVEARDGVVTLRGPVRTRAARDEALLAVRHVEGVRELKDELKVGNAK